MRYSKIHPLLLAAPIALALPAMAVAQTGPSAGEGEFILGGSGSSDKDFDNTSGGLTADLGWYWTDNLEFGIRQSINYSDISGESIDDDYWNGATRAFTNLHIGEGAFRPFIGASLGGVYGDGVEDKFFAGPELGAKAYVREKTFIYGRAEYQFFFEDTDEADDRFSDGAWAYGFGIGYNF